ncbi:MAG TPA: hypothetical protein VGI88_08860 [Verrucomicrobiae bacterium]|jgi:hypothetical protein
MKQRYKKKAMIGIPLGLSLFLGGFVMPFLHIFPRSVALALLALVAVVCGLVLYVWGCLSLAEAKGYSTALVLTVFLGVLFPVVVLLALPDKNKHHRRHPNRP